MILPLKYAFFSLIAILINILFQYISLVLYSGFFGLYISMFLGTFMGLLLKYFLDKKYIFNHISKDKKDESKKFILYTIMGILTTFIFWGLELTFDALFEGDIYRYLGALLGLSIGYTVKYLLDKKYVFNEKI